LQATLTIADFILRGLRPRAALSVFTLLFPIAAKGDAAVVEHISAAADSAWLGPAQKSREVADLRCRRPAAALPHLTGALIALALHCRAGQDEQNGNYPATEQFALDEWPLAGFPQSRSLFAAFWQSSAVSSGGALRKLAQTLWTGFRIVLPV